MTLKTLEVLDGDLAEQTWQMYLRNFGPLAKLAVQRHVMKREEFDQVAADPRIDKFLMLDDAGTLAGVATFTRCLDAVPLISPDYFAAHYPDAYDRGACWYIPFVLIDDPARGRELWTEVILHFYRIALPARGIVGLDVCTHNEVVRRLPRSIELVLRRVSNDASRAVRADSQNYWLYDMDGSNNLTPAPSWAPPKPRTEKVSAQ